MQTAAPPQLTSTQRIQLAVDRVMGIGTTPEDIVEEWEGRRPELEEKRKAIERLRNEGKNEPKADHAGIRTALLSACNQRPR